MQDGSAAEIYRLYEYSPKEGAEPSANFYLGIAAEYGGIFINKEFYAFTYKNVPPHNRTAL